MTTRHSPWTLLAAFAALLLLSGTALAAGKKAPNPNNGHGKITALSNTSITVTPKTGDAKTFTITPSTQITLDGVPATAADLATGQRAHVKSDDGTTALKIKARTHAKEGKGSPITPAATL